jgi:hypothetical protein
MYTKVFLQPGRVKTGRGEVDETDVEPAIIRCDEFWGVSEGTERRSREGE